MKQVRVSRGFCKLFVVLFLLFLLLSCATQTYKDFYIMDLQAHKVPVMLNADPEGEAGRKFRAVVSREATSSTTTYSGYNASVTVTTTTSSETTTPIDYQVFGRTYTDDREIRIEEISFFHHIMMMPYYGENYAELIVDVAYKGAR